MNRKLLVTVGLLAVLVVSAFVFLVFIGSIINPGYQQIQR